MSYTITDWRVYERSEELMCVTDDGQRDCIAEVRWLGPGQYRIRIWNGPFEPGSRKDQIHNGTLEEAKALAVALVKMR
jgi:hypothetical protein